MMYATLLALSLLFAQAGAETPAVKRDCLAGLCLGSRSAPVPKSVVTVAEKTWQRDVKVCRGQIVQIGLTAVFESRFDSSRHVLAGAVHKVSDGDDGRTANYYAQNLISTLQQLGWSEIDQAGEITFYRNSETSDLRAFLIERRGSSTVWVVHLGTLHIDERELCADVRTQGL